jgi:4-hydroxy-tetrahydrodipicolinate synthase
MKKFDRKSLIGVWSAAPTPFLNTGRVDTGSVKRMVEHHCRLGVKGLFLLGTNGEGPWMTDGQRRDLVRAVVEAGRGRLVISVQVSDNSAGRILDNMAWVKAEGADLAIIAPPFFLMNANPDNVLALYQEAIRQSPLPVGIYDRGDYSSVKVPPPVLKALYGEPKVMMIKDSSGDPVRRDLAIGVRARRPGLVLLTGNEFDCAGYLKAGYDGLLLGGAVFNGYMARLIFESAIQGDHEGAQWMQDRMNQLMWKVYGGKKITCWLAGEKYLLVQMGLFKTPTALLRYPLTASCRRAIDGILKKDRVLLMPWESVR